MNPRKSWESLSHIWKVGGWKFFKYDEEHQTTNLYGPTNPGRKSKKKTTSKDITVKLQKKEREKHRKKERKKY